MRMAWSRFRNAVLLLLVLGMVKEYETSPSTENGLAVALRDSVLHVNLDKDDYHFTTLLHSKDTAMHAMVDYDPTTEFLYVSNDKSIVRIHLNGSGYKTLVSKPSSQGFEGIAVDWVAQNLYFVDLDNKHIEVLRLENGTRRVIVTNLGEPRAIQVDPIEGYLFWTDWGNHTIERSLLDGTEHEVLVSTDIEWPNGITLDRVSKKVYWADAKKNKIEEMDYEGQNRKVLLKSGVQHVFSVTLLGDYIYWTSWKTSTVERANRHTGQDRKRIQRLKEPMGLVSLTPSIPVEASGMPNELAIVLRDSVSRVELIKGRDPPSPVLVNSSSERVSFSMIDYDPTTDFLYLTNEKSIERVHLNGSGHEILIKSYEGASGFEGIAVDWVARNLYLIDLDNKCIEVFGLRNGMRSTIITDVESPRELQVDPFEGYLFWTDWGKSTIERSLLDGTEHEVIVSKDIVWPNGMTLDRVSKKVYWADAKKYKIEEMDYDGQNRKVLLESEDHFFSLTLLDDYLYWTSWTTLNLERMKRHEGQDKETIRSFAGTPFGVVSLTPSIPIYGTNPCAINNGDCDPNQICLYRPPPHNTVCVGSEVENRNKSGTENGLAVALRGSVLHVNLDKDDYHFTTLLHSKDTAMHAMVDYDPTTEFLYVSNDKSIVRIHRNGSGYETLVSKPNSQGFEGIAVDWVAQNLYFVDLDNKHIEVLRLGNGTRRVIVTNLGEPRAIQVDPIEGYLFWTDWGNYTIERSLLDGTEREVLVSTDIEWPNGITLDRVSKKVYWADAKKNKIEEMDYEGQNRKVLLKLGVQHVFSVTLLGDYIYWTSWKTSTVERANRHTGQDRKRIQRLKEPMGLVSLTPSIPVEASGMPNELAIVLRDSVSRVELIKGRDPPTPVLVNSSSERVSFSMIDYDPTTDFLYLTNEKSIERVHLNGSGHEILIKTYEGASGFEGIAVDWVARNLYLIDLDNKCIEVFGLRNGMRSTIITDVESPRELQVDPFEGYLFWTDWGKSTIERSLLDGTEHEVIVSTDIVWPNGLTLDRVSKKVYWADAKKYKIEEMDYDGQNRKVLLESEDHFFSLTLLDDYLYWTSWTTRSLERMKRHEGQDKETIRTFAGTPYGVVALTPSIPIYGTNPCAINNGGCDPNQICLYRPPPHNTVCVGSVVENRNQSGTENGLAVALRDSVLHVNLDKDDYHFTTLLHSEDIGRHTMVDYDPTTEFLYVSNDKSIVRIHRNGSGYETLVSKPNSQGFEGIAVDWVAQNLYFVDLDNKHIEVLRLENGTRRVIVTNLGEPRAIQVDPIEGYLFWTDWGNHTIERSLLDGTEHEVLVSTDIEWPNGITLDRVSKKVYWADAKKNKMEEVDYEGQNRKVLLKSGVQHVFSVTLLGDYIYWTSWITSTVERVNRHTGQDRKRIQIFKETPMGLVSLTPSIPVEGTNPCAVNNGGCDHDNICFYRPPPHNTVCWSSEDGSTKESDDAKKLLFGNSNNLTHISLNTSLPTHVPISSSFQGLRVIFLDYHHETGTIYFSNIHPIKNSIFKTQLDGTASEEVLSLDDESSPEGVAIDWIAQNLYWVTPEKHKITVSRLNGSSPIDILTGLDKPRAICLDPANGYLYWSDWGEYPAIERSFLDGTGREAIVTDDLGYPNGIAIDLVEGKIYWGDAKLDRIEVCDLDGSNRRSLITQDVGHVFGMSLLDDNIYWSDWITRRIEKANKNTGEDRELMYDVGRQVMGLKAVDINRIPKETNSCGTNNGQCSHLCLYRPPPLTQTCACPDGMVLSPNIKGFGGVCRLDGSGNSSASFNGTTDRLNETDTRATERNASFSQNTTDASFNVTGDISKKILMNFNKTEVGLNNTNTVSNKTIENFNRTKMNNMSDFGSNKTDTGYNMTRPIVNGINGTAKAFNETHIKYSNVTNAGVNNTDISFQVTTEMSNTIDASTTILTTTTQPPESTEEPVVCPCDRPQTKDSILDHFCMKETAIVVRAKVMGIDREDPHLVLRLRKWKKLYKPNSDDVPKRFATKLKVAVVKGIDGCSCIDTIEPRKRYLLMGKVEDGKLVPTFIMPASGPQYRKGVKAIVEKNACTFHTWAKLQEHWASLNV